MTPAKAGGNPSLAGVDWVECLRNGRFSAGTGLPGRSSGGFPPYIVAAADRTYRAGDDRAAQLGAVIDVGKWNCSDLGYGHRQLSHSWGCLPETANPFVIGS